ncbi:acyl-CoA dehydrogenase family protein [Dietzia psychralcaliphila]|uniref:Acyl-[acyl-carrier-protein] dehydrogenase MbtN n=1 Tax=Dietzia psychralcaliphila TaxID=139021 RepID=A0AAD0JWF7_9ACTN|nr:acyl-CoA dehydrogenase family protein [Dietzia psychralcaliphila]AWH96706.1 acyl-CoA dehydrogenase [Dietzia psychralcaliphila]PTM89335.1 acyl-CoA dehydrogenase [Dietzia psychralcaliphila]
MTLLFPDYRPSWETDDHRLLREHARAFFAKEMTPNQEKWARQKFVDRETWLRTGGAGLICLDVPEEFGGQGGDPGMEYLVTEELVYSGDTAFGMGVGSTITPHYVANYATDEQKQAWLPKICSGEWISAIAMTEPGAGSDLQGVRTTARREGEGPDAVYVINGSKTFISNGGSADFVVVAAKTDLDAGHRGMALFAVEADTPGFERGRVLEKMGRHGADTAELFFNDMRVPAANLLGGEEGQGFYQLMNQLPRERLAIAVDALAMAEAAVVETLAYVRERQAFGKPILEFQNTRFELATCKTSVMATRTFIDHCIQQEIAGELDAVTASMAKLQATDMLDDVVDRCLQLFGGYGYMMEYPIAQKFAAARVMRIYGGTNEIMKEVIGRAL